MGLSLFATAYDPLDLASDNNDPLGFQKAYMPPTDRLLPEFTTLTSVLACLSMLCAGVRIAEELHPHDKNRETAKARGRLLEALRNFKKAVGPCLRPVGIARQSSSSATHGASPSLWVIL
jgi:hypothetical protein